MNYHIVNKNLPLYVRDASVDSKETKLVPKVVIFRASVVHPRNSLAALHPMDVGYRTGIRVWEFLILRRHMCLLLPGLKFVPFVRVYKQRHG